MQLFKKIFRYYGMIYRQRRCGNSSVVERHLAKVNVAGSSLVSRSIRNRREKGGEEKEETLNDQGFFSF